MRWPNTVITSRWLQSDKLLWGILDSELWVKHILQSLAGKSCWPVRNCCLTQCCPTMSQMSWGIFPSRTLRGNSIKSLLNVEVLLSLTRIFAVWCSGAHWSRRVYHVCISLYFLGHHLVVGHEHSYAVRDHCSNLRLVQCWSMREAQLCWALIYKQNVLFACP